MKVVHSFVLYCHEDLKEREFFWDSVYIKYAKGLHMYELEKRIVDEFFA